MKAAGAALFLLLLPYISARAFAAPVHEVLLVVPVAAESNHLHHFIVDDDFLHSRQRRASNPYAISNPFTPVGSSFFEGPERGIYSQPSMADIPHDYFQNRDEFDDEWEDRYNDHKRRQKLHRKSPRSNKRQDFDIPDGAQFVGPDGPPAASPGNKYVYQPLFKYTSTHKKHHKLFVPNIFG